MHYRPEVRLTLNPPMTLLFFSTPHCVPYLYSLGFPSGWLIYSQSRVHPTIERRNPTMRAGVRQHILFDVCALFRVEILSGTSATQPTIIDLFGFVGSFVRPLLRSGGPQQTRAYVRNSHLLLAFISR